MNTYTIGKIRTSRSGNALVIALGFSVLVIGLITAASTSSTAVLQDNLRRTAGLKARAAVEAVLQRYESSIIAKAQTGELLTWTGDTGQEPNFGQDFFGECRVKWKIEPCRTVRAQDVGATPGLIEYMTNPSPSTTTLPNTADGEVANDYIYLYQVSAEARLGDPAAPAAVAQGVRYVSINEQPLFRYVIFYAQRGAKGDIEFSHYPQLTINGNVHSNGAIYLGSTPKVNNWGAVDQGNGDTVFGPNATGGKVLVEGLDGIFRLNKPLMFAAIDNELNSGSGGVAVIGGPQRGSTPVANCYDLVTPSFLNETTLSPPAVPNLTSLNTATQGGRAVNPYRIVNDTPFITGAASGVDPKRKINGLAMIGDWNGETGNDSRDTARSSKFSITSIQAPPSGWGGYVRTGLTNCQNIKIPKEITGGIAADNSLRPLEAQRINAKDSDLDPTTDNHEASRPVFASAGATTETIPAAGDILEIPGLFMTYALLGGTGDVAMKHNANGRGWSVTTTGGAALPAPPKTGLVIRERPIPETAIWPGGAAGVNIVNQSSENYVPYAYGKHWRPSNWPFFIADVSDGVHTGNTGDEAWGRIGLDTSGVVTKAAINNTSIIRQQAYSEGGSLLVTAAVADGRSDYVDGWYANNNVNRKPRFYNDNWRFVHMKRPQPSATTGVSAKYFKDARSIDEGRIIPYLYGGTVPQEAWQCLTGTPNWSGFANTMVIAGSNVVTSLIGSIPAGVANASERYSVRYEGFIVPQYSQTYTFKVDNLDDGCRIWLDGKHILEDPANSWKSQGGATYTGNSLQVLTAGQSYHLVVDFVEGNGGDSLNIKWSSPSQAEQIIPQARLRRCQTGTVGFVPATVTAVQAQIDTSSLASGPAAQKAGLMIRDGRAGLSPLLSGRDAYAGIFYSPTRGFFVQRRLAPAHPSPTDVANLRWFTGGGSANQTAPTALTILSDGIGDLAIARPDSGNATYNSVVTTYAPVTRDGRLTIFSNTTARTTGYPNIQPNTTTPLTDRSATAGTYYLGDGTARSAVYGGSGLATKSTTWRKRERNRERRTVRADLSAATGIFIAADLNKALIVFDSAATATTTMRMINTMNINAILNGGTRIELIANGAETQGTWANGSTVSTNYGLAANYVYSGNVAEMNSVGAFGRTDWVAAPAGYTRSGTTISTINPSGGSYPLDSAVTPAPVPTAGNFWPDALAHSFALARSNTPSSVFHDTNSWVSAFGTWFSPAVNQNTPWQAAWDAFVIPSPFATTSSFRPDLWYGKAGAVLAVPAAKNQVIVPALIAAPRWLDDQPNSGGALPALGPNVFLRIERGGVTPNFTLTYKYYSGVLANPAPTDFVAITNADAVPVVDSITGWSDLLIGPAVQSGSKTTATTARFTNLRINLTAPAADSADVNGVGGIADGVVDRFDWDTVGLTGTATPMARYLASQYQAFWGGSEITEDFFSYVDLVTGQPLTSEDWIYNPREFWSQSNKWEDGTLKDSGTNGDGSSILTNRLLWAKTTLLTLDLGVIQSYLKARLLSQAVRTPITAPAFAPVIADDYLLSTRFTGLIYAARTNRYPWNPDNGNRNPFSPAQGIDYPNQSDNMVNLSAATMNSAGFDPSGTVHNLQPYPLAVAPAFKPQDFHHGVRLKNGTTTTWGYTFPENVATQTPAMTESRTTIVTPGQLYLQGNLNTGTNRLWYQGAFVNNKTTPMAVMGDAVTLLSNSFQDIAYQNNDIKVFPNSPYTVSGTSPLAIQSGAPATSTTYNTAIVTNNQPTTRQGVREGQGAPVVDTLMYIENWGTTSQTMNYKGSLVVMDSRRYTRAFLLDVPKDHGRTMMGTLGWNAAPSAPDWGGATLLSFSAPTRVMLFNDDLLTEEGTPPFAPFGVTASGIGGWVKTVR